MKFTVYGIDETETGRKGISKKFEGRWNRNYSPL